MSDTVEALGSVTWRGLSNTVIGLEVTKLWLLDDPGPLLFPADAVTWSLRVNHDAMRERLHVSAVAVGFGLQAQYGWLARADVRYDVIDALSVGLAYVHYGPGEEFGPLSGFDYHDRVAVQLRYAFSVL